ENGTQKAEHLAESRPRFSGSEWEMVFNPESGGALA
ncbi:TPA: phage tail protein, partial [Klebsiella pneumoniae]|nr:phage tail protein [Klebsiella pneumoniae]